MKIKREYIILIIAIALCTFGMNFFIYSSVDFLTVVGFMMLGIGALLLGFFGAKFMHEL